MPRCNVFFVTCVAASIAQWLTEASPTANILVAYDSGTNWTKALAGWVAEGASSENYTSVRLKRIQEVACDDLTWADGIALGSPVYWAMMSARSKEFLDNVQERCFGWPVKELRFKIGAAFATGGHTSSGKDATIQAFHGFFMSVQMIVVGGEFHSACHLGACATHPDGRPSSEASLPQPEGPELGPATVTASPPNDGHALGKRLAQVAAGSKPLREGRNNAGVGEIPSGKSKLVLTI